MVRLFWLIPFLFFTQPSSSTAGTTSERLAPPPITEWESEVAIIRQSREKEIADAKTDDTRYKLARALFDEALDEQTGVVRRYALLLVSKELMVGSGDFQNALIVVNELGKSFEIDDLAMQAEAVLAIAAKTQAANDHGALVTQCLRLIDAAILADRFDVASQLASAAYAKARQSREVKSVSRVVDYQRRIAATEQAFQALAPRLKTLEERPLDPAANSAVGEYRCFRKGDWDGGVPMLALGSDPTLRRLAVKELGIPSVPEALEVSDGWWAVAQQRADRELQQVIQLRAGHWYRVPLATLDEEAQIRVNERLDEIDKLVAERAFLPADALLVMTFDRGTFARRGNASFSNDFSGRGHHALVAGASLVPGKVGESMEFDGKDTFVECLPAPDLAPTDSMTLCAWVYVNAWKPGGGSTNGFISKDDWKDGGTRGFVLRTNQGSLDFTYGAGGWQTTLSKAKIELATWHHVAATHGPQGVRVYLDGALEGERSQAFPITPSENNLRFGCGGFDKRRGFKGKIDEVIMFRRQLTSDEIRTIYLMGMAGRSLAE